MRLDNFWKRVGLCVGLVGWLIAGHLPTASAQSDSAGFNTVINVPPSTFGNNSSIGSNTQLNVFDVQDVRFEVGSGLDLGSPLGDSTNVELNVFDGVVNFDFSANSGTTTNIFGGSIGTSSEANSGSVVNVLGGMLGNNFDANQGSIVNISSGRVGFNFEAQNGSVINVSGGSVGNRFGAFAGSEVTVSGGTFGADFEAEPESNVTFVGGEFLLNGVSPANPASVTLSGSDVLTGTLEDGSVFVFSPVGGVFDGDNLSGVTLQTGTLPANNVLPVVVSNADGQTLGGLRSGQSLTLQDGGELSSDFSAVNATLNMLGGTIGGTLQLVDSVADVSGGTVDRFDVYAGSTLNISGDALVSLSSNANGGSQVNISGGTLTSRFDANAGSAVNVSGGSTGFFVAEGGSTVIVSGGEVGSLFASSNSSVEITGGRLGGSQATADSEVTISGGNFDSGFIADADSDVTIQGGEFLLDGIAPADLTEVTLTENDVLTGTLEDGSVFVFSPQAGDALSDVTFETVALPELDVTPIVIDDALDVSPAGLRTGQSLTLGGDGALSSNFAAVDATLIFEGGSAVEGAEVVNSTVTISDGEFAAIAAFSGSEVSLSGGQVDLISLFESTAEISDGQLGNLHVSSGSVADFTGGSLEANGSFFGILALLVDDGGTANVSGGTILGAVSVEEDSQLNLFVLEASLDGVAIDLSSGDTLEITERNVALSGELSDGSPFSFWLSPSPFFPVVGSDSFAPGSTVTVTLASAGPEIILGDVDQDGVVDFLDISPFIATLASASPFIPEADCNQDGEVNFFDITSFIAILSGG